MKAHLRTSRCDAIVGKCASTCPRDGDVDARVQLGLGQLVQGSRAVNLATVFRAGHPTHRALDNNFRPKCARGFTRYSPYAYTGGGGRGKAAVGGDAVVETGQAQEQTRRMLAQQLLQVSFEGPGGG